MTAAKVAAARNPAETPRAAQDGEAGEILLTKLRAAEWNARKTFTPESINKLAASIKAHGVLVPLIVRQFPESSAHTLADQGAIEAGELLEIVAGHRRFQAAERAGLEAVPCRVRVLSDDQAREIALVDNLQREAVEAMEEAAAFNEQLKRLGSIAAVAARVGEEQGYVAKRLKLCSLGLSPQDALRERLITIDHALLLARLGEDEQDAALKWCLDHTAGAKMPVEKVVEARLSGRKRYESDQIENPASLRFANRWEPQSVQRLKEHIAQDSGTPLSRAPWDLNDAALIPDCAACNACPQNTSANLPLFGDLAIGEPTCTDGGCFKEKTQAFVEIQIAGLLEEAVGDPKKQGKIQVLRVSWKGTNTPPRFLKGSASLNSSAEFTSDTPDPKQIFKAGQWIEAKKACAHICAAVTVDWSDGNDRGYMGGSGKLRMPGEILQVCIAPDCKVNPKSYGKAKEPGPNNAAEKPKTPADIEKRKQAAIAENKIRVFAVSAALEKVKKLPAEYLRELLGDQVPHWGDEERVVNAILPGIDRIIQTAPVDGEKFAQAAALLSLGDTVYVAGSQDADSDRKELLAALKKLGYDASKAWDQPKAEKAQAAKPGAKKAAGLSPQTVERIKTMRKKIAGAAKKSAQKAAKPARAGGKAGRK